MKKPFKIIGYLLLFIIVLLTAGYFILNKKMPVGVKGEKAEALAQKMVQAVNKASWDSTAIISWKYSVNPTHLWDKKRNLAQVEWENHKVLLNLNNVTGRVWDNQAEVKDPAQVDKLVKAAYKYFINDAFWLNPVVKVFDPGVERSIVTLEDGTEGLMASYTSGGLTPGDSYLWVLDADGTPKAWRIWVNIIPVGGLEFSWDNWQTLPSGAKVATSHKLKTTGTLIPVANIKSAMSLEEYGLKEDPFLPLFN